MHSLLDDMLKLCVLQSHTAAALLLSMSTFFWVSRGGSLNKRSQLLDFTYLIYRCIPLPFVPWPPGSTAKLAVPGDSWMEREYTSGTIFSTSQDILTWLLERP